MRTKIFAIAALAAISSGAFASSFSHLDRPDDADLRNHTALSNDIYVKGFGFAWGQLRFSAESSAVVNSEQRARNNEASVQNTGNTATGGGAALFGAQGNVGVNIAAGAGNGQSNQAALAAVDAREVFASAQVFSRQSASGNTVGGTGVQTTNTATMADAMLQGATGNVGVNIAAGAGNLQSNALAASVNAGNGAGNGTPVGVIAKATASNSQSTSGNSLSDCGCGPANNAAMNGFALAGARGNIGVNIGAGAGNAQSNGLAISNATR